MMNPEGSVYERVLGPRFADLQPQLQAYFSLAPDSDSCGFGRGTFDVAGCPVRWLRPMMALAASDNSFFGEFGYSVPFTIRNHAHRDNSGRPALTAVRRISFPEAIRTFEDSTVLDPRRGLLDLVGRHRRIATFVHLDVTAEGHLRISSAATRLQAGPLRLAMPAVVDARAYTEQWWDEQSAVFRIQTKVIQPQLGSIFVYAGRFDYRLEPYSAAT
ncbi:DUF4166 domain-containing protein [Arthrobacter pigmenti]